MTEQRPLLLTGDDLTGIVGESVYRTEFFVSHCKACFQTLVISKRPLTDSQIETVTELRCPACSEPLSQNLACRSVQAQFDTPIWKHPAIIFRQEKPKHRARFTSASLLFGLSSSISFVDALIGGLKHDTIALIKGSKLPLLIAERYCVRVQLSEQLGGFDGRDLFIDGGNSFDSYLFTSMVREYSPNFNRALNRIIISRAFTPYELLQLVEKDSERAFEDYNPQLLVISDIFNLFNHDIEEDEAKKIVLKLGYTIRKISQKRRVPIVLTCTTRSDYLEYLFREYCNVEAEFIQEEHQITSKLIKHPSKQPTEIVQEFSKHTYNQKLLAPLRMMQHG
ncbi:MAG: hypothetical protein HY619_05390 [Thaumarchaeota archaeon]|nr:hypothetical protein [Nitrososphaerota archaeon]